MTDIERKRYKEERTKYVGIIERYAKKKLEDDQNVTSDFAADSNLTESQQKMYHGEYTRRLNELRQDPQDYKVHEYAKQVKEQDLKLMKETNAAAELKSAFQQASGIENELVRLNENELASSGHIRQQQGVQMVVVHAYCPNCGDELTTNMPKMFNPFTGETLCKHVCINCGNAYNLEYSYPRLAIIDDEGNEVKCFGN